MGSIVKILEDLLGPVGSLTAIMTFFVSSGIFIDSNIRDEARVSFGEYLSSGKAGERARIFSTEILTLFERIFGKDHWTLLCFRRSCLFTTVTAGLLLALTFLHHPVSHGRPSDKVDWVFIHHVFYVVTIVQFPFALLIDYLNLFKTRKILGWLSDRAVKGPLIWSAIIGFDFVIYVVIYITSAMYFGLFIGLLERGESFMYILGDSYHIIAHAWAGLLPIEWLLATSETPAQLAMFLAGFVPSMWIWASVAAIILTHATSQVGGFFAFVKRVLPIEEKPGRSVGIIAGLLCSIGYLTAKLF